MLFVVCFHCVEVFTYDEGHCCPFREGKEDKRNTADVVLIRAEPAHLRDDSTSSNDGSINNQWLRKIKRLTIGDFKFSIVESETGEKTSNKECRTTNNDVYVRKEATSSDCTDIFHLIAQESRKAPTESYTPPAFPVNVAHYLRHSSKSKINNFTSTLNTSIANDLTVCQHTSQSFRQSACYESNKYASTEGAHMECQTTQNDGFCSNEVTRIENPESVYHLEPKPRNANQQSCIPQAFSENVVQSPLYHMQHEINKNTSTLSTHIAEPPVFFQQAAHSFRQSPWYESMKYAYTQCSPTLNFLAFPNMSYPYLQHTVVMNLV